MMQPRQAFVAMGSNLGDRQSTLMSALRRLSGSTGIHDVQSSPIYETVPVGELLQPMFLNSVIALRTTLSPENLLEVLLETEREFVRVRMTRWGPRTLDLDLLIYEEECRNTPSLSLPHPRIFERAFVFVPFRDLLRKPGFQAAVWDDLRQKLESQVATGGIQLYTSPNDEKC